MAKQSGLGDNLYIAGYNLSGDIGSLGRIGGGPATFDVTGIDKSGIERIGVVRDGAIEYNGWFNPAVQQLHERVSALPTADQILTYCRGTLLGSPAASLVSKQLNYDGNRGQDGSLSFAVAAQANGFGIEWGRQLTAGVREDTAATNGASIDTTASASFGAQAYLQVFSFTGTDATVKIQDSADNAAFADVASFAFTQITAGRQAQRISIVNTATVRRYLRAITVTTGGFTLLQFSVNVVKNETAGVVF